MKIALEEMMEEESPIPFNEDSPVLSSELKHRASSISLSSTPPSAFMMRNYGRGDTSLITTRRPRPTSPQAMIGSSTNTPQSPRMTPNSKRQKQIKRTTEASGDDNKDNSDTSAAPAKTNVSFSKQFSAGDQRVFRVEYPSADKIEVPSKSILIDLMNEAMDDSTVNRNAKSDFNDQVQLKPAGILSLEQVLLPAIALQEERALKKLQAKIQRDHPEYKMILHECRKIVRQSILHAIQAVHANRRDYRHPMQDRRRQEALEGRQARRQAEKRQQAQQRQEAQEAKRRAEEEARQEHLRALKRKYPRNKDLWKEIVVLTRSRTQLEKEERVWKQAEQSLKEGDTPQFSMGEEISKLDAQNEKETRPASIPKDNAQDFTESTIQDMVLASKRIQQGLVSVIEIMEQSEQTRQELYKEYRREHHFHGYQRVRNPKSLIRLFSQED